MFDLFQLRKRLALRLESEKAKKEATKKVTELKKVKESEKIIEPEKVIKPEVAVKKETLKNPVKETKSNVSNTKTILAYEGKELVGEYVEEKKNENPLSKKIYAYVGKKLVGEYDSITKCGIALGMPRPAVKKAIESGETLDNGFKLKFK